MKNFKKVFALALVLMLALALCVPAFADDTGTITINGTTAGKDYDLYRIFDLTYAGSGTSQTVSYTLSTGWVNFFIGSGASGASYLVEKTESNAGTYAGCNELTYNGTTYFINITNTNVTAFAAAAHLYAVGLGASGRDLTAKATGTSLAFNSAPLGYYLVYPRGATSNSQGALCSLNSAAPSVTINVKGVYPTIEKEVNDPSVEVGQSVEFTVTGSVPNTAGYSVYNYIIHDSMSAGLTFNATTAAPLSVKIGGTALGTSAYTVSYASNGFTLTIPMMSSGAALYTTDAEIEVKYHAVVNENAVVTLTQNSATLEYSNDPTDSNSTETNPPVVEDLYSSQIEVVKVNNSNDKLSGAKFVLVKKTGEGANVTETFYKYDETNEVVSWVSAVADATEKTTGTDGKCSFIGLEDGTYYLRETEAPEGYNALASDVEAVVTHTTDQNGHPIGVTLTKTIENQAGTQLPSTGGVGTTIFYVLGGVMVLGAVAVLVARKRVSE